MNYKCLFSIITVCYNASETIERTIKSVLAQNYADYEYLIIDGASTDCTKQICDNYIPLFGGKMLFYSEPDKGIYDAMNKGAKLAKGKYILFMNADDLLTENALETYARTINDVDVEYDIIYGNTIVEYDCEGHLETKIRYAEPHITQKTLLDGMGIVHQSMITSKRLFEQLGGFNLNFSVGADWDFLIRSVKQDAHLLYISEPMSVFSLSGASSYAHNKERHIIRKENKIYSFIDYGMIKDYLRPSYLIQTLFGQEAYNKIRYYANKKHN